MGLNKWVWCQFGRLEHDAACQHLIPLWLWVQLLLSSAVIVPGIINSRQAAVFSKLCGEIERGLMVFPSKHRGGPLGTVQPRAQTTAAMEEQSASFYIHSCMFPPKQAKIPTPK